MQSLAPRSLKTYPIADPQAATIADTLSETVVHAVRLPTVDTTSAARDKKDPRKQDHRRAETVDKHVQPATKTPAGIQAKNTFAWLASHITLPAALKTLRIPKPGTYGWNLIAPSAIEGNKKKKKKKNVKKKLGLASVTAAILAWLFYALAVVAALKGTAESGIIFFVLWMVLSVAAFVMGIISLSMRSRGKKNGQGAAIAGLIAGGIAVVILLIVLIAVLASL